MLRHFASLAEIVEDFEAAVRFYEDVLKLEVERLSEGYALVRIPGALHFGIWSRAEAAQATYGSPDAANRVPLGFSIGFEVDKVGSATEALISAGVEIVQPEKTEPWGQVTSRFITPSGALCEIAETPWARRITQDLAAE